MSVRSVKVAFGRVGPVAFLGVLPLVLLTLVVIGEYTADVVAVDFSKAFYPAAQDVADGISPYPPEHGIGRGAAYVYTPTTAFMLVPLSLLPLGVAQAVVSVALLACFLATLYVLEIRDWRIYGAVLLSAPFVSGLQTANLTFLLGLLAALAWRLRDHRLAPGVLIGVSIALKPFVWPLTVWLLTTRRLASFVVAATLTALSFVLVLPFSSLGDYLSLVDEHTNRLDDRGYTVFGLLVELGVPDALARTMWLAVGLAVLVLGRKSFPLCVVAALLLSPIVWLHYFALLAVPLAILRAPLWVWLLPLAMWLSPGWENGEPWQTALVLVVTLLTLAAASDTGRRRLRTVGQALPKPWRTASAS